MARSAAIDAVQAAHFAMAASLSLALDAVMIGAERIAGRAIVAGHGAIAARVALRGRAADGALARALRVLLAGSEELARGKHARVEPGVGLGGWHRRARACEERREADAGRRDRPDRDRRGGQSILGTVVPVKAALS